MNKHYSKEILTGKWFYDKTALMTVKIFALNYDYNYEIAKADQGYQSVFYKCKKLCLWKIKPCIYFTWRNWN